MARTITDPDDQEQTLTQLVVAAAQAGDLDRAEALARTITDPDNQTLALAQLAAAVAGAGDLDRASRLAADAEALARTLTNVDARGVGARRPSWRGRPGRGLRMCRNRRPHPHQPGPPGAGAHPAGRRHRPGRDLDRAEALARTITNPDDQAEALTELAAAAAQAGDIDHARRLLAHTVMLETSKIRWLVAAVSRLFPSVIRDAGDVFLGAYKAGA